MAVDLHTHTNHSDGTLNPEQLVREAVNKKLTAIAITDHDITSANEEAIFYSKKFGINVVPGVELSIDYPLAGNNHMHILGLFIDFKNTQLNETLAFLRKERKERGEKIIAKLKKLKINIDIEELLKITTDGSIGRPHIARLLVSKKYVSTLQQAFERYLRKGAPAYVKKVKLKVRDALKLIRNAKGIAVIAHPVTLVDTKISDIAPIIFELQKMGLDGLEVYSPLHSKKTTDWLLQFCKNYNFAISGGSDFHGENKSGIFLGNIRAGLTIPDTIYRNLKSFKNKGA